MSALDWLISEICKTTGNELIRELLFKSSSQYTSLTILILVAKGIPTIAPTIQWDVLNGSPRLDP